MRAAWAALLLPVMPEPPARILDLGCGTGSLAVLLAQAGHEVTGIDTSAQMLALARAKAATAGVRVDVARADAADPPFRPASADVVLCRHVLWALPDRDAVLATWARLLRPGGRLVLVEGSWGTGVGLPADECRELVLRHRGEADVRQLAPGSGALGAGRSTTSGTCSSAPAEPSATGGAAFERGLLGGVAAQLGGPSPGRHRRPSRPRALEQVGVRGVQRRVVGQPPVGQHRLEQGERGPRPVGPAHGDRPVDRDHR